MKSPNINKANLLAGMNRKKLVIHSLVLLLAALLWPLASAQAELYSFTLVGPNVAQNGSGDTIRVTGAGLFNTDSSAVAGRGAFAKYDAAGNVTARGTWAATSFESLDSDGGLNKGSQGGVLKITITLFPKGGAPVTDQLMTVVCPFEEDEGVFDEDEDGTTVGDFSEIVHGITVFHLVSKE